MHSGVASSRRSKFARTDDPTLLNVSGALAAMPEWRDTVLPLLQGIRGLKESEEQESTIRFLRVLLMSPDQPHAPQILRHLLEEVDNMRFVSSDGGASLLCLAATSSHKSVSPILPRATRTLPARGVGAGDASDHELAHVPLHFAQVYLLARLISRGCELTDLEVGAHPAGPRSARELIDELLPGVVEYVELQARAYISKDEHSDGLEEVV